MAVTQTHLRALFHCENVVEGEELILTIFHNENKRTALHIPMWMVPYIVRHLSHGARNYAANAQRIVERIQAEAKDPEP